MKCQGSGYSCGQELPDEMFLKKKGSGYSSKCVKCREKQEASRPEGQSRKWALMKNYGLRASDYDRMLEAQDGKCLGCFRTPEEVARQTFDIDHCHETGKIRGLLCWHCNTSLGHAQDSIEVLQNLIKYLERSRSA